MQSKRCLLSQTLGLARVWVKVKVGLGSPKVSESKQTQVSNFGIFEYLYVQEEHTKNFAIQIIYIRCNLSISSANSVSLRHLTKLG